ncbi:MAG: ATP-binding cassette domain-containing protein [Bacteroidetes bacterium]|nr:ATP-binding cassette domain-containing protein [Bacteroidota bacterium]
MEAVIKIRNLYKSFGTNEVLKNINLTLNKGENIVILGRSGIGKSVLAKCIVGLLQFDKGSIEIFNQDISSLSSDELDGIRKKMGYLFQGGALYDSKTVRENLEFPLQRSRFAEADNIDTNTRVEEVLENVGLLDAQHKMPAELSGGMKKRVGLARTLILQPEIIFYDEPTTGLDPVTSKEISQLMVRVQNKYKTSSLIITHDLKCAKTTANNIKLLRNGNFYAEGTYNELENSEDEVVKQYFN